MSPILPPSGQPPIISLWEEGEIDTTGWNQPEEIASLHSGLKVIRNVSRPSLTAYLPDPAIANGTATKVFMPFEASALLGAVGSIQELFKPQLPGTGPSKPQRIEGVTTGGGVAPSTS